MSPGPFATRRKTITMTAALAASVAIAFVIAACEGDDISEAEFNLPPGSKCGVAQLSVGEVGDGTSCTMGTVTYPDEPLGMGYRGQKDVLPPKVAYLTFDDGPSEWTAEILDTLKQKKVRATFFINSFNLKGSKGLAATYVNAAGATVVFGDLLKRTVDEGHALGNHTLNHIDLALQTAQRVDLELDQNEFFVNQALVRAGGNPQPLALIRTPFGSPWYERTPAAPDYPAARMMVGRAIAARGVNLMWSIDSSDADEWAQGESYSRTQTPQGVVTTLSYEEKRARTRDLVLLDPSIAAGEGAVILMHDTHNTTRDAVPEIIDGLVSRGYTFATLEEYVKWRWNRTSVELTPGPSLGVACTPERDRGCLRFGATDDPNRETCGRMWQAYQALGGTPLLGAPTGPATTIPAKTGLSQPFERGRIDLRPDLDPPCNVIFVPR